LGWAFPPQGCQAIRASLQIIQKMSNIEQLWARQGRMLANHRAHPSVIESL
jgi:hypothetical protein